MQKNLVSIVIPAYNEEMVIESLLKTLKNQTYKNIEIIVVDDGSKDKTIEKSQRYTDKVYKRKHAERSVQRNFGAKKAKGNYLIFLDADMELSKKVLEECVRVVKSDKSIGAVVIPEESVATTFWGKVKAFERSFYNESGDLVTDAARFFTRKAFEEVGGYDESITGPEDWDLPESVKEKGYRIERIHSKIYHHERVPNPFKLAKKKYYYGLKAITYMSKHKVSPISAKTIYFLRPVFYKNWKRILAHPVMSLSLFCMLTLEQIGGGIGYLVGSFRK